MRYAQIRSMDVSNGEGIGVALFVQGCHLHCYNCFNPNTWDFDGGKKWTQKTEDKFIELASRPYIKRISILGGEPLAEENLDGVLKLVSRISKTFPKKTIWLYTGYTWEQIFFPIITDNLDRERDNTIEKRKSIIERCNILVDGRYEDSKKDITLKWCGSRNQRVIDVQKSLQKQRVILLEDI